jgi:hypothetical protein
MASATHNPVQSINPHNHFPILLAHTDSLYWLVHNLTDNGCAGHWLHTVLASCLTDVCFVAIHPGFLLSRNWCNR